ncbi:cobalt-zinc-cadmium efflux system outer membrane protein [Oxalobacteraceae bacterium GrIS 1.11]
MHRFLLSLCVAGFAMPATATTLDAATDVRHATLETDGALTLPAALALALQANPDLAAARAEVAASDGSLLQARQWPNPELQSVLEDTRRASRNSTLQLNQTLELGGKRAARTTVAGHERALAEAALAAQQADTRAAVALAFIDVLAAQEGVRLARDGAALAQQASRIAAHRVGAGKASPVEETRARVAEAGVKLELTLAEGALAGARRRLSALWGNPAPRFGAADGALQRLPDLPAPEELARRLRQAPVLRQANGELALRLAMAELEKRRRIPDLTLSVGVKRAEEQGRTLAIVGLSIPLPLFDTNQGNLLQALRRSDKADAQLSAAQVRAGAALADAGERLRFAREEAQALDEAIVPGAHSAYEAASRGFEFGKFAMLDVLDAQRTLLQAQSRQLRALADAHRAAAEIERILGPDYQ